MSSPRKRFENFKEKPVNKQFQNNKLTTAKSNNVSNVDVTQVDSSNFDYRQLDSDIASYLQQKENNMREIVGSFATNLGRELYEAQQKLASHDKYNGMFEKWYTSLGLKKQTVYNYINRYKVVQNLDNMEDVSRFEEIPLSLSFDISKPSVIQELKEKVLKGEVTSHKEYKELEKKIKQIENKNQSAEEMIEILKDEKEQERRKLKYFESSLSEERKKLKRDEDEIKGLQKELEKIRREKNYLAREKDSLEARLKREKERRGEEEKKRREETQKGFDDYFNYYNQKQTSNVSTPSITNDEMKFFLKESYRELSKKYHPDQSKDDGEKFKSIKKICDWLEKKYIPKES